MVRKNSYAIVGGAFGDEGKGKVVDYIASKMVKNVSPPIVYRWSGGSNAGHTVVFKNKKIVLHQIPSGALIPKSISILGKGMVIHPQDLATELKIIKDSVGNIPGKIIIDELATLCLDTHRAFEATLKGLKKESKASTGRGISPAYCDVLLRHPVKVRDLASDGWRKILSEHFDFYSSLVSGLGSKIEKVKVPSLRTTLKSVGTKEKFLQKIDRARKEIIHLAQDTHDTLEKIWKNTDTPFIFEGAQGVGLDYRWGAYPDITAADPTLSGIFSSTQGLVNPKDIEVKAAVYKATYMSSVGTRTLPSKMDGELAKRIRDDANEYGATTGRPRDIYHIDVPALSFFAKVSGVTHFILTHMDISYPEIPIKICINYEKEGVDSGFRPDQTYLDSVSPHFFNLPSWDGKAILNLKSFRKLPGEAKRFILFYNWALGLTPLMVTTGPQRDAVIEL